MKNEIECRNIYKNEDINKRKEEFTKKWIELVNFIEKNKK